MLCYKRSPLSPQREKTIRAIAAIHSQNNTAEKPPEILLSLYIKNITFLHTRMTLRDTRSLILYAHFLNRFCHSTREYRLLARFLRNNNIVEEYIHYITTRELPGDEFDEGSEDYLQDSYDF